MVLRRKDEDHKSNSCGPHGMIYLSRLPAMIPGSPGRGPDLHVSKLTHQCLCRHANARVSDVNERQPHLHPARTAALRVSLSQLQTTTKESRGVYRLQRNIAPSVQFPPEHEVIILIGLHPNQLARAVSSVSSVFAAQLSGECLRRNQDQNRLR